MKTCFFLQLCVGAFGNWIHARNVRFSCSIASYIRWWINELQLLLSFDGTYDWEFSEWKCHGYASGKHEVHFYFQPNYFSIWLHIRIFLLEIDLWFKYWIPKCMIWCTPTVTTHISISVTVGSCWISNVNLFTRIFSWHGKWFGLPNLSHHRTLCYSLRLHCSKPIETLFYWIAWILRMLSNSLMVWSNEMVSLIVVHPLILIVVHSLILMLLSEMAERHNMPEVLKLARNLVHQLQTIIENK